MMQSIILKSRAVGWTHYMTSKQHNKPYFCPLNKEYYLKFKAGEQNCEIRPANHRGWNKNNIYPGREIALSNGYQEPGRLVKKITRTVTSGNLELVPIPKWHIDAVEAIYGKRESWLIAFVGD